MTLDELTQYYENLLIRQYNQQPKARATIGALAGTSLANNITLSVRDGITLANAKGVNLDIIGGLVGVNRVLPVALPSPNYFQFVDSSNISTSCYGFFDSNTSQVPNWFWYDDITAASLWSMDDDTYRRLIQYIIGYNTLDMTLINISYFLANAPFNRSSPNTGFHTYVEMTEDCSVPMAVTFYIYQNGVTDLLVKAVLALKVLPIPMCVTPTVYLDGVLQTY